jgi:hypothetical protein
MTRDRVGRSNWPRGVAGLGLLIATGAAAQTTTQTGNSPPNPPMTAPMVITAPAVPPAAARRDSGPADPGRLPPREDAGNPNTLGAPTFVQPGAVSAPYAAPQYPYPAPQPYAAPSYGPGANPTAGRGCRQYAPAYDEAGRFLANVCIR